MMIKKDTVILCQRTKKMGGFTDEEGTVGENDAGTDCKLLGKGKTDQSRRTDSFFVDCPKGGIVIGIVTGSHLLPVQHRGGKPS